MGLVSLGSPSKCRSNTLSSSAVSSKDANAELRPSKAPDQRKLPDDDIDDETELGLPREFEPILDLALYLAERGSGSERFVTRSAQL